MPLEPRIIQHNTIVSKKQSFIPQKYELDSHFCLKETKSYAKINKYNLRTNKFQAILVQVSICSKMNKICLASNFLLLISIDFILV